MNEVPKNNNDTVVAHPADQNLYSNDPTMAMRQLDKVVAASDQMPSNETLKGIDEFKDEDRAAFIAANEYMGVEPRTSMGQVLSHGDSGFDATFNFIQNSDDQPENIDIPKEDVYKIVIIRPEGENDGIAFALDKNHNILGSAD